MSQQSGSTQSCSEASSSESQSGSAVKPKPDFSKKHGKLVRILTVIAYMISVSTAAVLLSAYYVFLWNPATPGATESPTTLAMARVSQTQNPSHHNSPHSYSSFALPASQYIASEVRTKHMKTARRNVKSMHHQMPTPQGLVMQREDGSSTAHQLSKRSTGVPAWQTSTNLHNATNQTNSTSHHGGTGTSGSSANSRSTGPTRHPAYIINKGFTSTKSTNNGRAATKT